MTPSTRVRLTMDMGDNEPPLILEGQWDEFEIKQSMDPIEVTQGGSFGTEADLFRRFVPGVVSIEVIHGRITYRPRTLTVEKLPKITDYDYETEGLGGT